jgi:hypothetical protein
VRQRRTVLARTKLAGNRSTPQRRPFPQHSRADDVDADQRCGRHKQYSARKAGTPATPHVRAAAAGWNLLCMVQKQDCLCFAHLMISF